MVLALGLMSGTSLDGVDAALLRSDGVRVERLGHALTLPYQPGLKARIRGVLGGAGDVPGVEQALTVAHADAVAALLERANIAAADVRVVGFHGQTILHQPERGLTWQIGDGALLASRIGIDVVVDFRRGDMAAGGQGAPLVPLYHRALAADLPRPLAILNVGGVANVTWIGADDSLVAFDTGPGNALLDDWVQHHCGLAHDDGGRIAAGGTVDAARLARWLDHPYFGLGPPKSLDRDAFAPATDGMSPADGAATLTAFTAAAAARALDHLPAAPRRWLVTGGGRHNRTLMAMLAARLGAVVAPIETAGWDGDAMEAEAFAFLAVRSLLGLPLSDPASTGARYPAPGGAYHRASALSGEVGTDSPPGKHAQSTT
ncbi:MAG: anhydro-N-acetylmuramic acid kinase [Alphaproteobacteria bacterium]|nr:anhydro-N-acetylmuramic acid kinase [Alphaproteobacteria bacterium]